MFNSYRLLPAHGFGPCSGGGAEETRERFPAQPARARSARSESRGAAAREPLTVHPLQDKARSTRPGLFCCPPMGSNPVAVSLFQMKQKIPFKVVRRQSKWDFLLHLG